jgi:homogentisate 1,2-dioxygenase
VIDRAWAGLIPQKPHTVHKDSKGELLYEEMHTRSGFSGAFTYFYHRFPITPHREVAESKRGWPTAELDPRAIYPLRRRLYDSGKIPAGGQLLDARTPILFNKDVTILLARPTETDDAYFANGDGDELWFVHEGAARLESPCGWLDVKEGDYVWVPRSMVHRWHVARPMRALCFEAHGGVMIPADFRNPVGQLKMDAPYTHRDFVRPQGPISTPDAIQDGPRELVAM